MTYEAPQRKSAPGKTRPSRDKGQKPLQTVLDTLRVATQETRTVASNLSTGPADAVIGHVQAIFDPVLITTKRLNDLTHLTGEMASELERVKADDKPGDIAIKIEDKDGPLAKFHHTRESQNNDRDTLFIYPDYFMLGRPGQIYTLIHEAAHAAQPSSDLDIYSWTRLFKALKGHPAQLRNPDAVAYFIRMMYSTRDDPAAASPLTEESPQLGQERGPSDLIDRRLPEGDRKFIALALAVAEAKLLAYRDLTEPREGAPTPPEREARHELASTILGEVFSQPIEVITDVKSPWRSIAQSHYELELPVSHYRGRARGWQGWSAARDVHKFTNLIIKRLVRLITAKADAGEWSDESVQNFVEEVDRYFSRDPRGQSSVIPTHMASVER